MKKKESRTILKIEREIKYTSLLFCMLFGFAPFVSTFNGIIRSIIGNTYRLDTLLMYGLCAIIALYALPQIVRSIDKLDVVAFVLLFAIYLLSMLSPVSDTSVHIEVLKDIIISCIPAYLVAISVTDYEGLYKYLRTTAYVILGLVTFNTFILGTSLGDATIYSQNLGYIILPASTMLMLEINQKRKIVDVVAFIYSVMLILTFGARGPFLCVAASYMMVRLISTDKQDRKFVASQILLVIVAVLVYINFYSIAGYLTSFLESFGLSTRIVNRLLTGDLFQDNARAKMASFAWDYSLSNPLLGSGLVNDRVIISNALYGGYDAIGQYPHNFFLELMMQFGLFPGSILILLFFSFIYRSIVLCKTRNMKAIITIAISAGFFPLLVSGSYINKTLFYCLLGCAIGIIRRGKMDSTKRSEGF